MLGLREVGWQEDYPLDEERKGAGQRERGYPDIVTPP